MQRIESNIATQFADITRPRQTAQDLVSQAIEANKVEKRGDAISSRDISAEELSSTVAQIQKVVQAATGRALSFEVDEEKKGIIVTVKDDEGEIIRQIPSEEVLALRRRLEDLVGVFLDDQA
ncbi:MAG: flagellar protein FlaG [Planctomycetota bacterium]|nr:MAG: flagellar protein FlaG [Planctomycetota bacterium]